MASRKLTSQHATHRRMVVSMPNLQDIAVPELPPRNSSLRKVDTGYWSSSAGDVATSRVCPPSPAGGGGKPEPVSVEGDGLVVLFLAI